MHHLGMELHAVDAPPVIGDGGKGRALADRHDAETLGQFRHPVAMAHPDLVLLAGIPEAVEAVAALADIEHSAAAFAVMAALPLPAELGADGLLTVADAEDREAEIEHLLRGARRVFLGGGCRAAGEDHAFQPAMGAVGLQRLAGFLEGHDLAVDARLPHAAGDELGDLRTEIYNKNAFRHRRSYFSYFY